MSTLGTTKARDWHPYVCRRTLLFLRRHHVAGSTFEAIQPTGTFQIMIAAIRGWRQGHTNLYALPRRTGLFLYSSLHSETLSFSSSVHGNLLLSATVPDSGVLGRQPCRRLDASLCDLFLFSFGSSIGQTFVSESGAAWKVIASL